MYFTPNPVVLSDGVFLGYDRRDHLHQTSPDGGKLMKIRLYICKQNR